MSEDWRDGSFQCLHLDWYCLLREEVKRSDRDSISFVSRYLMRTAAQTMRIKRAVADLGPRHKLQQNRATVPLPQLYGFGPSMGQTVYATLVSFKRDLLFKSLVHNS
ncbi:hypothetical protein GX48_02401 [Paracoccidioides brasiliensis]|nr:hypothetical protein GX48_02401 [Paracoccidioides brasiliensis]